MAAIQPLEQLRGLPCRAFRLIAGGSLILYLGDWPDGALHSDWRLHLEPAWRLDGPTGPLVGSFDACVEDRPADWVIRALDCLVGVPVKCVDVSSPVLDLRVAFVGGYLLTSFAHSVEGGENWELRHRTGLRVGMRGLTEWTELRECPDNPA